MSGTLKNYYEILGVPRSATTDQIRTAYRKLLLKFHPDKNVGDTYFEEWSKKINEAFEVLKDPEVRAEYDLVYDEARATASRPIASPDNVPTEDESHAVSVAASIQRLAPVYISAKQAYIKAARNVAVIEGKLGAKRMNATPHFLFGGILIIAILVWMALTNKNLQETSSLPAVPVADQAAIIPLPGPLKQEATAVEGEIDAKPVDLWLKVVASKAYFFEQPEGNLLDDKFLSKGNKLHAIKKAGNYYYGVFQSAVNNSYKIEGWIKKNDVEILAQ